MQLTFTHDMERTKAVLLTICSSGCAIVLAHWQKVACSTRKNRTSLTQAGGVFGVDTICPGMGATVNLAPDYRQVDTALPAAGQVLSRMSQDNLERRSFQLNDAPRMTIALEPGFWRLLEQISALRRLRLERVVADALAIQGELDRAAAIRLYVGNYFYKSALAAGVLQVKHSVHQLTACNGWFKAGAG